MYIINTVIYWCWASKLQSKGCLHDRGWSGRVGKQDDFGVLTYLTGLLTRRSHSSRLLLLLKLLFVFNYTVSFYQENNAAVLSHKPWWPWLIFIHQNHPLITSRSKTKITLYLTIICRRRSEYRWIKTETNSRFLFTDIHWAWGDNNIVLV